jgi:hypothetical protein
LCVPIGSGCDARATQPAPTGEQIMTLPFHLKDGFILIDGQLDGTRGVFILDTGMPFRIILNRHFVPLENGVDVKRGNVASGQAMIIQSHDGAHPITLAGGAHLTAASGARFTAPTAVLSADFGFIETAITPRFLGFIGWGLLKEYEFRIDYDQPTISFYPLRSDGTSDAPPIRQSNIAAVIKFTPASPIVPFMLDVDGLALPSILDTGGHERLMAPPEIWSRLSKSDNLTVRRDADEDIVSVRRAGYDKYVVALPEMEKVVGDKTLLTLGYPFLRNYRSTWNPAKGDVTLERK